MATVKIKFRASSVGMKEGTLFFQVIHKRVARQVSTGLKLYPHEWDAAHGGVVLPPDADDVRLRLSGGVGGEGRQGSGRSQKHCDEA